jgi:serine protease
VTNHRPKPRVRKFLSLLILSVFLIQQSSFFLIQSALADAPEHPSSHAAWSKEYTDGNKVKLSTQEIDEMTAEGKEYEDAYVVTVVDKDLSGTELKSFSKKLGSSIPKHQETKQVRVGDGKYVAMKVPKDRTVEEFIRELNSRSEVLFVEPSYKRELSWTPNDPEFSNQWQLQNITSGNYGIQMPLAWSYVDTQLDSKLGAGDHYGGRNTIIVAVIDTGLAMNTRTVNKPDSYEHDWTFEPSSELPVNLDMRGVNIVDRLYYPGTDPEEEFPDDDHGHGTHVSSIIAGATHNSSEGAGIAYNVKILPIKAFAYNGSSEISGTSTIIDALGYAIDAGSHVINMSYGGPDPSSVEESLINLAVSQRRIPVAATGNWNNTVKQYPAAYTNCIAVGASNPNGSRSAYSTYGDWIDLVAPVGYGSSGSGFEQITYSCFFDATEHTLPCTDNTLSWRPADSACDDDDDPDLLPPCSFTNFSFEPAMGTSFAAPQVSAVAALLKSIDPNYTFSQVRYKIQYGATPKASAWVSNEKGYGILNAYETLRAPNIPTSTHVYRFWSNVYNGHFYTTSTAERDYVINTWPNIWILEGAVFKVPTCSTANAKPVYRFWSARYNGHFYTVSTTERDIVINNYDDYTWQYEGQVYCAYSSKTILSKPVYRFWSARYGHHFYTASTTERDIVINNYDDYTWQYEGPVFYVSEI